MSDEINPGLIKGRGKGQKNLTVEERKFITDNFDKPGWTDERLAEKLGRNPETIARFRKKLGLKKRFINGATTSVKTEDGEMVVQDATEQSKINYWKSHLRSTSRYKNLKKVLMTDDLEFFMEKWALYHIQFEDMTATEEDNIEQLIMLDLRLKDNLKARRTAQEYEKELERQITALGVPSLDVEIEQQRRLRETIISNNRMQLELNKEYREMVDKYEKMTRAMNATREQRESKQQVGGDTFLSLVRSFNDRDKRKEIGRYNELMKLAGEKKLEDFKKPHLYLDNNVEPIVMLGKDYIKEDKDTNDNTKV